MPDPLKIASIGEAMVELSLNRDEPDRAAVAFAGDTLNTAIYLKRSAPDHLVSYVTRLGIDDLSGRMVRFMADEGLDTAHVGRDEKRLPGLYAISTDDAGERSFSYWRSASAARLLFDDGALSLDALASFDVIYASAISLAIMSEAARERFLNFVSEFRRDGGRFVFDSNFRPALWESRDAARETIDRAWRMTDIALPSIDDEMALFGDATENAVLERFARYGLRVGALKRGALGPLPLDGSTAPACAPVPRVVDSTAAGDSFNAGFLAAHFAGRDMGSCLVAGHGLACKVIGWRGAIMPREGERK